MRKTAILVQWGHDVINIEQQKVKKQALRK